MPDIEVKYTSKSGDKLTLESLHASAWWRLLRVVFAIIVIAFVGSSVVISGQAIQESSTIVENKSTLVCDAGGRFNLKEINSAVGINYVYGSSVRSGRYTTPLEDAKIKVFCTSLGRASIDGEDPVVEGQGFSGARVVAAKAASLGLDRATYATYSDISSREESNRGEDMGYVIESVHDYTPIYLIAGWFLIIEIVGGFLLLLARGIVLYVLVGRFL